MCISNQGHHFINAIYAKVDLTSNIFACKNCFKICTITPGKYIYPTSKGKPIVEHTLKQQYQIRKGKKVYVSDGGVLDSKALAKHSKLHLLFEGVYR